MRRGEGELAGKIAAG